MKLNQAPPPPPRKIAIFLPSLGGGGAEKSMVRLAVALSRQGILVDLVVAAATGPVRYDVPPSVNIVDLGCTRVLKAIPSLIRYLRSERPTALLSAMYHANLIAIIAHFGARSSARLVVSERQSFFALQASQRGIKERLIRLAMQYLYPRAHAVSTVSKAIAAELVCGLGLPKERVIPIYNPVVSDAMLVLAAKMPMHPWLAGAIPVVLGVGRLVPEKDFANLIRAVALIARERPIRLLILGDGPLRRELVGLAHELGIGDRVDLPGRESNPWAFMSRAAVFVLSSISEGMPSVLVEAMAIGTRVVSTDCPTGPREVLGEGSPALVPVGDSTALARAIVSALDNPGQISYMAIDAFSEAASSAAYRELLLGESDTVASERHW